jgi:hypothetical protein
VWKRTEDEVETGSGPIDTLDRHQLWQIEVGELRKNRTHLLPGLAVGGQERDNDST